MKVFSSFLEFKNIAVAFYNGYALKLTYYKINVERKVRWKMDFANRGNRPAQSPQNQAGPSSDQPSQPSQSSSSNKMNGMDLHKLSSLVVLFAATLLMGALIYGLVIGGGSLGKESGLIKQDRYQAVFLDSQDGQVYFGKLAVYNRDLYMLTDIYYVRVENPIQPEGVNQPSQPNISLAKLGNELHGPEDYMFIARDKVLYWENLKNTKCTEDPDDCSQVYSAIMQYIESGGETQQTQQPAQQETQPAGTEEQNDTPTETPTETPTP